MQEILNLKNLIIDASMHITFIEIGIFMLYFLVFMLVAFVALIFWHYRLILFITFVLEMCILVGIPFGIAYIMRHYLYPIEIMSAHLNPLTYTTGFRFNINFKNKSKHTIKECVFSVVALREEKKRSDKLYNFFLPLGGGTDSIKLELKPQQSYQWSGIINGYDFPSQPFKTAIDCH